MPVSLQVAYPNENTTFDLDYYLTKHMEIVKEHFGPHMSGATVSRGLSGGAPGSEPPFHVIATLNFADEAAIKAALGAGAAVAGDIPNFYNGQPVMMVGEVLG